MLVLMLQAAPSTHAQDSVPTQAHWSPIGFYLLRNA